MFSIVTLLADTAIVPLTLRAFTTAPSVLTVMLREGVKWAPTGTPVLSGDGYPQASMLA